MTATETPATERLSRRRQHRRLMFGSLLAGVLVGLVLRALGYPLAGEAVYWVGILGFLGVWASSSATLFDERDRALERRASGTTLTALAFVLVVGASAARVLPRVTSYTVPPEVHGALYAYVSVFVLFGLAYVWTRYRS